MERYKRAQAAISGLAPGFKAAAIHYFVKSYK